MTGGRESSKTSARPLSSSVLHFEPKGVPVATQLALTMMELLMPFLGLYPCPPPSFPVGQLANDRPESSIPVLRIHPPKTLVGEMRV